jgi:CheY-like chemotaxis protein
LSAIFELFTQGDRALDRSQGGLGIGLTLVRRLIELHGGTVEAHSAGPGQGSEFEVRLPLLVENGQPTPVLHRSGRTLGPASCRRILIVEDHADCAATLASLMKYAGHQVRIAHDGPRALEAAEAYNPDLILLDIGLPGMDGYEVARRLRTMPSMLKVVVVAITGYGQEEDRIRSRDAGIDHHLIKPVDLEALRVLVDFGFQTDKETNQPEVPARA